MASGPPELLAENVANAETPGYRGRDLKALGFADHMKPLSIATDRDHRDPAEAHLRVVQRRRSGFGDAI